jgi:hypothetical protein
MDKEIKTKMDNSVRKWKIAGGLLVGVLILLVGTFGAKPEPSLMEIYPWLKYVFSATLFTTCFVFFVIWKKDHIYTENKESNISQDYQNQKERVGLFLRTIAGLLGIILSVITVITGVYIGFRGWMIIIIVGGFSVLFLYIAITGKKP